MKKDVSVINGSLFSQLVEIVLEGGAKRATKYVSRNLTVKATLQGTRRKSDRQATVLLTIGTPNYIERQFIKDCIKAGEPFPVKKVQVKWPKTK